MMRKDRLRRIISKLKQPAYLVTSQADLFYLTGIELDGFWLLLAKRRPVIITSELLAGQLKKALPGTEILTSRGFAATAAEYCRKTGIRRLGADFSEIDHSLAEKLEKFIKIEDTGGLTARIRQVKDRGEIANIRKACGITVSALKHAKKLLKPGVTEKQIMFKIEEYFAKNGARPAPNFRPIVAFGPDSANPHHVSSDRKLIKNDIVLIDLGCEYKGYCSDLTRTFILGKISNPFKGILKLVKKAHARGVERVKSGVKASVVDKAARKTITDGGYGANFIHTTGHGVGIQVHEPPRLSPTDTTVLKQGMTVTVEPGVYLSGKYGARHEDLVLITKKGNEVLTDDLNR
jgi:Xaa-Pro aminopeptidase